MRTLRTCGCGGIGRRTRFRFWRLWRGGSSPFTRTNKTTQDDVLDNQKELLGSSILPPVQPRNSLLSAAPKTNEALKKTNTNTREALNRLADEQRQHDHEGLAANAATWPNECFMTGLLIANHTVADFGKPHHVHSLDLWRNARNAVCTAANDMPEEAAQYQLAEEMSIALCSTPATSPEWRQED